MSEGGKSRKILYFVDIYISRFIYRGEIFSISEYLMEFYGERAYKFNL